MALPGRTTSTLVAGIIEVDAAISLDPFIDPANDLVTEVCAPVTTYTSARLELIERWLAAHFYAIRDLRAKIEQAGPVRAEYFGYVDLGFSCTMYGQQALLLDTAGGLAALENRNEEVIPPAVSGTVGVVWLGKKTAEDWEVENP